MEDSEEEMIRKLKRTHTTEFAIRLAKKAVVDFNTSSHLLVDQDIDSIQADRKRFVNAALLPIGYTYEEIEQGLQAAGVGIRPLKKKTIKRMYSLTPKNAVRTNLWSNFDDLQVALKKVEDAFPNDEAKLIQTAKLHKWEWPKYLKEKAARYGPQ
ncbi:hypothetical protein QTI05_24040 [Variovorax sp. J22R193]|uniref:hypothetical protein n=1 Tax=Variovorax fucosicus TaxID=3053517 RepID=UPI0025752E90|nr:hypothetical protein [Variovorax sp. J22R193]MDM0042130.1 hypothetical protein [Variovorax sp. J22R193]